MATRGESCNDWPRTVMTGGCLLVAFAPDGVTGNDDAPYLLLNMKNVLVSPPVGSTEYLFSSV